MDIKRLRYFLAIIESGSISAAAHKVGVTQQALSRSIFLLEEELGIVLMERTRTGITLTPRGSEFKTIASNLVKQFDVELEGFAQKNIKKKILNVGLDIACLSGPGVNPLYNGLNRVNVERVNFHLMNTDDICKSISSGEIDFALTHGEYAENPNFSFSRIGRLSLFVVASNSTISKEAARDPKSASSNKIIGFNKSWIAEKVLYEHLIDHMGKIPEILVRVNTFEGIRSFLQSKDVLCFFYSDNPKNARRFWGMECFQVDWVKYPLSYGLLTARATPSGIDWPTFVEFFGRACGHDNDIVEDHSDQKVVGIV